jgi:hypothetical protein
MVAEIANDYALAKALEVLLDDVCFPSVEVFAISCRNALGDNIETFDLAGCIFVEGKCVDEAIDAADAAAAAAALKATEEKNLAAEVAKMKKQMFILTQIVTQLCVQTGC